MRLIRCSEFFYSVALLLLRLVDGLWMVTTVFVCDRSFSVSILFLKCSVFVLLCCCGYLI